MSNCWAAAPYTAERKGFIWNGNALFCEWDDKTVTVVHDSLVAAIRDAKRLSEEEIRSVYEIVCVIADLGDLDDPWIDGTAGILIAGGEVYENRDDELAGIVEEITDGEEEWDD